MQEKKNYFESLPEEILLRILELLIRDSPLNFSTISQICKFWHQKSKRSFLKQLAITELLANQIAQVRFQLPAATHSLPQNLAEKESNFFANINKYRDNHPPKAIDRLITFLIDATRKETAEETNYCQNDLQFKEIETHFKELQSSFNSYSEVGLSAKALSLKIAEMKAQHTLNLLYKLHELLEKLKEETNESARTIDIPASLLEPTQVEKLKERTSLFSQLTRYKNAISAGGKYLSFILLSIAFVTYIAILFRTSNLLFIFIPFSTIIAVSLCICIVKFCCNDFSQTLAEKIGPRIPSSYNYLFFSVASSRTASQADESNERVPLNVDLENNPDYHTTTQASLNER